MSQLVHFRSVSDVFTFFKLAGHAQHPLVAVVDFGKLRDHVMDDVRVTPDFYSVIFKHYPKTNMRYGRKPVDFQDGSMICLAPGQVLEMDSDTEGTENHRAFLNYCMRFYERQFITRTTSNNSVVVQVEKTLNEYFHGSSLSEKGLPTVKFLAEEVHLSPGYLSDLLKKETGKNAQDHIHLYLIEEAKNILLSTKKSVGEIAYSLGFEYPQYFNKLFKKKTGKTPVQFRNLN
ncbi:helix-turn-helix domain-containing protein [Dyadobacter luticola]|uniref:Helix-turn-helix transcriptional regulator n=1 Tax=Dyadobacter luticola TaxID=1979387 RepID=A0A5R9L666_9BACT|nr:AraC family transcriptional regulator [Dyadobacter luticola]TLV03938.1 helix-turn-helix transcriptional regulator [Dyadobacter luticola]